MIDCAEIAVSAASVTKNQKGCGSGIPTLHRIGTVRMLTHRVQA
jgi:hypothetical protein